MINQINSNVGKVPALYADQTKRSAWREEMLAQVLEKVRETSPMVAKASARTPRNRPVKGSVVDVIV
ncbi:MAG: hypothetical protein HQK55_10185 [Deltaproteobacteria bacterium]|nr:hypothetical protein [Deltaproteobacteria bacterium]